MNLIRRTTAHLCQSRFGREKRWTRSGGSQPIRNPFATDTGSRLFWIQKRRKCEMRLVAFIHGKSYCWPPVVVQGSCQQETITSSIFERWRIIGGFEL